MTTLKTPFDFAKQLSSSKEKMDEETFESNKSLYIPFLINRSLSYHLDCIFASNELNLIPHLDPKLQYDFYFNIIRKKKRYSKWCKRKYIDELKEISQKYKCNFRKAKDILQIFQLINN